MIKINLLESKSDQPIATSTVVNKKVSNPMSRLLLMAVAAGGLFLIVATLDIVNSIWAKAEAEKNLANEKEIAVQLEGVIKEQAELEKQIKNIDIRIEAIKKLRGSQAGPSAVLEAVRERFQQFPGLYLESIDQKGEQLVIKGDSPDENVVTQFGRSLEFSSGLFTALNIETQRKEITAAQVSSGDGGAGELPKVETINFTIRCSYSPSKATTPGTSVANATTPGATLANPATPAAPANQPVKPAAPTQVAAKTN
jgi:Tfp pilus assembly protein PilN